VAGASVSPGEGKAVEEEEISTGEAFCVAWMIAFKVNAIDVPWAFESICGSGTPGRSQASIANNKTTTSKEDRFIVRILPPYY
jgi:hypothetical protein